MKRKKKKTFRDKVKFDDLKLLRSKLLMATIDFIDDEPDDEARKHMKKLFITYKKHKGEVKKKFQDIFEYLTTDRVTGTNVTKEQIKVAKKEINAIAKKVWRKK